MSPPAPGITAELRQLLRRLKLGQMTPTLPERLALARANDLPRAGFLEMILSDEVARRDATSAERRAPLSVAADALPRPARFQFRRGHFEFG